MNALYEIGELLRPELGVLVRLQPASPAQWSQRLVPDRQATQTGTESNIFTLYGRYDFSRLTSLTGVCWLKVRLKPKVKFHYSDLVVLGEPLSSYKPAQRSKQAKVAPARQATYVGWTQFQPMQPGRPPIRLKLTGQINKWGKNSLFHVTQHCSLPCCWQLIKLQPLMIFDFVFSYISFFQAP